VRADPVPHPQETENAHYHLRATRSERKSVRQILNDLKKYHYFLIKNGPQGLSVENILSIRARYSLDGAQPAPDDVHYPPSCFSHCFHHKSIEYFLGLLTGRDADFRAEPRGQFAQALHAGRGNAALIKKNLCAALFFLFIQSASGALEFFIFTGSLLLVNAGKACSDSVERSF
jgi:hypothetical protein